jgi:hypothetical protein
LCTPCSSPCPSLPPPSASVLGFRPLYGNRPETRLERRHVLLLLCMVRPATRAHPRSVGACLLFCKCRGAKMQNAGLFFVRPASVHHSTQPACSTPQRTKSSKLETFWRVNLLQALLPPAGPCRVCLCSGARAVSFALVLGLTRTTRVPSEVLSMRYQSSAPSPCTRPPPKTAQQVGRPQLARNFFRHHLGFMVRFCSAWDAVCVCSGPGGPAYA